ncbi:hypothetical protein JM946_08430 [Steroidobacter sp. S1-65]|uniref:Uncharacterized protein n=1 Tax=Steroidobacter gossypii TaxID=2805490 RepID=A0ABS1WUX0_9GAMM|nr:hypothetical protein [Steroidobacter gossypii]MBM0104771.1 hypothetical protein [Steroidobacter gossypii]
MKLRLLLIAAAVATTTSVAVADNAVAGEKLGQHPAVVVAQNWSARGIDTNTFIVAHPAGLQLIATPVSEKDAPRVAGVK